MKKKHIASAVAVIAASGAMAQSNVTVYGNIDLAIVQSSGTSSGVSKVAGSTLTGVGVDINAAGTIATARGSQTRMDSGMRRPSRIGFKGSENLGGGLKASFVVETTLDASGNLGQAAPSATAAGNPSQPAGTGIFGNRETTLSLEGGFGTVSFGRMAAGNDIGAFDAAGEATSGSIDFLLYNASSDRTNNTIQYVSPEFSGFQVTYQVSMSENQGNVATTIAGTQTFLGLGYAMGPWQVKLGQTLARDPGAARGERFTLSSLGVGYDFGVARLMGQYVTQRSAAVNGGTPANDANTWQVGVKVPVSAHTFSVNYISTNDKRTADQDANSWYLGYDYALSKRTTAYVGWTKVSNKNGATFSALANTNSLAANNATAVAARTDALFTGINHSF